MKRVAITLLVVLLLAWPILSRAQSDDDDMQGASQYNDAWDGQALRIAGYILTPVGMALEWGLTRPLHAAATRSPISPVLSGDSQGSYLDRNSNSAFVPPDTFTPYRMSSSNQLEPAEPGNALAPVAPPAQSLLPPTQLQPTTQGSQPSGQAVLH